MRTLYISDLDGTLLGQDERIGDWSRDTINSFVAGGGLFSIATARSLESCRDILQGLDLRLPLVLSSGVALYDWQQQRYTQVRGLSKELVGQVEDILSGHGLCGFLYTLQGEDMHIFYKAFQHAGDEEYIVKRVTKYEGRVFQRPSLLEVVEEYVPLYVMVSGPKQQLEPVHALVSALEGIHATLYEDIYTEYYFMEIFSTAASKANGAVEVSQIAGANEIVAFGDNYNDLEMLRRADRSYVPANGVDAAKQLADGVIGYCHQDGVMRFVVEDARQ